MGVLGKDVCGRSERGRRLCDMQIETAVFLQRECVKLYCCYRGPAACKCASVEICSPHTHLHCSSSQKSPPRLKNVSPQGRTPSKWTRNQNTSESPASEIPGSDWLLRSIEYMKIAFKERQSEASQQNVLRYISTTPTKKVEKKVKK